MKWSAGLCHIEAETDQLDVCPKAIQVDKQVDSNVSKCLHASAMVG